MGESEFCIDEPHMHCPVCLVAIKGEEGSEDVGHNATVHFKEHHPQLYKQIANRAKEAVHRAKSKLN